MTDLKAYATQIAMDPDQLLHLVHNEQTACGWSLTDLQRYTEAIDLDVLDGLCPDCFDPEHIDNVRADLAADDAIAYADDTLALIREAMISA